jgi:hypothetical protein
MTLNETKKRIDDNFRELSDKKKIILILHQKNITKRVQIISTSIKWVIVNSAWTPEYGLDKKIMKKYNVNFAGFIFLPVMGI